MTESQTRLRWAAISGTCMFLLSLAMQPVFPRAMGPLPAGLRTPILAFELARSAAEIETMFGPAGSSERATWLAQIERGNMLDFAFILPYASFLMLCALGFDSARGFRSRQAALCAALAGVADVIENACLFAIGARLGGDFQAALGWLVIATWTKWIGIALCLAWIAPSLLAHGRLGRAAFALALLPLPLALIASALRGGFAEAMLLADTLAFVVLWILALRVLRATAA